MLSTAPARNAGSASPRSYVDVLEEAWQQHLAPCAGDAPTVISLFAGCGGSSLGYSMAGYRELLAVEWDNNAVETFRLNFPDVPVYHGDITKLTVEEVLERTGLRVGELDVLDGSPPCQGFSTAGKRDMADARNQLFREYVRLLRGLRPKAFIMENVSGMVKGKMKLIFAEILRELKASGYRVSARLMNAMYFDVPQSRERMIFVGVREDLGVEPSHPRGRTRPYAVWDAWEGVTDREPATKTNSLTPKLPYLKMGEGLGRANARMGRKSQSGNAVKRLHPQRPSNTVSKFIADGAGGLIYPTEDRYISIQEVKRIGSFPDDFHLIGDNKQQWALIGNSVPPLFLRAIAAHLRSAILAEGLTCTRVEG